MALCNTSLLHRTSLYAGNSLKIFANLDNQQASFSSLANVPDELHKYYWLAGFIEGEGSFNVAFKLSVQSKLGFYPSPSFSLTQHFKGKEVLEMCKNAFGGIGSDIYFKSGSDTVMVYSVTNLDQLITVVIPFLLKYNKFSARKAELDMFIQVCMLMQKRQHLTELGLRQIVRLVFSTPLKKSGNRQLSQKDLLEILDNPSNAKQLVTARRSKKNTQA